MRKSMNKESSIIVRAKITSITENEIVLSYKNKNMASAYEIHAPRKKSIEGEISTGSWAHVKLDINDLHKGIITKYE